MKDLRPKVNFLTVKVCVSVCVFKPLLPTLEFAVGFNCKP